VPPESSQFSKKYLKVKYEVEVQNFIIDKLHCELKSKIKKQAPPEQVKELQSNLRNEIAKLRMMVTKAMFAQRNDKDQRWGPIPLSVIEEEPFGCFKVAAIPTLSNNKDAPEVPAEASMVSGLSAYEDMAFRKSLKQCTKEQEPEVSVDDLRRQISQIESNMSQLQQMLKDKRVTPSKTDCAGKRNREII